MNLLECANLDRVLLTRQKPDHDHFQASLVNAEELCLQPGLCCFMEAQLKTMNTLISQRAEVVVGPASQAMY